MILALAASMILQQSVALQARPFPGLSEEGREVGCMRMDAGFTLTSNEELGGYSSMLLGEGEGRLTLLSDAGHIVEADVSFGESGVVSGLTQTVRYPIAFPPALGRGRDTEALVALGSGKFLVSRERSGDLVEMERGPQGYRVTRQMLDLKPDFPRLGNNGFEAVAPYRDGFLLVPEKVTDGEAPVLHWEGETLEEVARLKMTDGFAVTEIVADQTRDTLFVLQRSFSRRTGPRARVSVVRLGDLGGDALLETWLLGQLSFLDGADNMEAMALREAPDGTLRLLLASDDNFNPVQRTVLMDLDLAGCDLTAAEPRARGDDEAQSRID
ncbi:esterase-like activity of phytase family protein [Parvularcula maris]|uniref:Esterase-like activity of phytase family protein n=1 Tax=Parvularcula maris TaxID=2965077 RepID=A0A9X2RGV9_9PROT|nr:esterase-like activity of phytase family protein [Parvularcula maris]MCQ8184305.1 esterase-like activity of phytase family protein [Parvularcula maris]